MVATFEGRLDAWRFEDVRWQAGAPEPRTARRWEGPARDAWQSSLTEAEYVAGVERIRDDIREGDVYQVNLCRVLSAPLPAGPSGPDAPALSQRLATGNPARYAARVVIPAQGGVPGTWVVSASPERYLSVDGDEVLSSPIKGTAAPGEAMLPKDSAENVMITDLIRNDLSRVAVPGSVTVPEFLALHEHPGLTHLQSTVRRAPRGGRSTGRQPCGPRCSMRRFRRARCPGRPSPPRCGSLLARRRCRAAHIAGRSAGSTRTRVGPSSRWEFARFGGTTLQGGTLRFGTGAGITWGSDPFAEWQETELKARRLITLASADTIGP